MRGPPVVLTNTLGRPVTNVISERGAVPMTVVNTLGEPVTLVASGGEPVTLFNENGTLWDYPFSLFANNEQGAWYDPSDFSTLFQNSTGTTPVTAVEQPVRLMLDRSRGLVLGAELATASSVTGVAIGGPAFTNYAITAPVTPNRWYRIQFDITGYSGSGSVGIAGDVASYEPDLTGGSLSANGTINVLGFFVSVGTAITFFTRSTNTCNFTNISVRELPGNHATAPNDASRPVLRARYNLLTFSEQFDDGAWSKVDTTVTANAIAAPNGTLTADLCTEGTAGSGAVLTASAVSVTVASPITATIFAKRGNSDWLHIQLAGTGTERIRGWFNLATGTVGSTTVTGSATGAALAIEAFEDGWYRCRLTGTLNGAGSTCAMLTTIMSADTSLTRVNNSTRYIWGAQLLTAADQTATGGAYQRIAAATDYDTSNPVWRPYLAFDGSDDVFNLASAISITTDMTVVRGFGRAAAGISSFGIGESSATTQRDFTWASTNDITSGLGASNALMQSGNTTTGYMVSVSRRNVSTEVVRLNGTQNGSRSAAAVSGSLNQLGRLGPSAYGVGPIYGLIVLDRELTGSELTATEQWMAGKTGATLA